MPNNPDINMAQGFVTSEPTGNGIKLYANDVDITDELGGSSLPAVTAEDNGDVLTVVDGEWGKATPSGGGVFDIRISWDDTAGGGDGAYVMDKEFNELLAAVDAGTPVRAYDEDTFMWTANVYGDDDGVGPYIAAVFQRINPGNPTLDFTVYQIKETVIEVSYYTTTLTIDQ